MCSVCVTFETGLTELSHYIYNKIVKVYNAHLTGACAGGIVSDWLTSMLFELSGYLKRKKP